MSRIETLTLDQEAQIPVFRDRWRQFAATPIDREKAKATALELYSRINQKPPLVFVTDSPLSAAIALAAFNSTDNGEHLPLVLDQLWGQLRGQLGDQLWGQLGGQLGDQLRDQLWDQLLGQLWGQLGDQLRGQLKDQLKDQLWDQLGGQLWPQLLGQLWDQLGGQLKDQLWDQLGGQLWGFITESTGSEWQIPWAAWFDYAESIGVKFDSDALRLYKDFCINIGWIFPYKNVCVICDKPRIRWAEFDNRLVLHSDGSPAVEYADGYSMWMWRGMRVDNPRYQSHSSTWDAKWLLDEQNAENRRMLIQGIGYEKILHDLEAQKLDSWQEYDLLKIAQEVDVEPIHLLKMTCPSTNKIHVLRTPPEITNARKAIAWVNHGIDPTLFAVQS